MSAILIIGKPNSGKSLLFNRLTGLQQKVANFPGVTVQVKRAVVEGREYLDFPGVYSFDPLTKDEEVAIEQFHKEIKRDDVKSVMCLLDATRLEASLRLGLQVRSVAWKAGKPVVFALNMMDEIDRNGLSLDAKALSERLKSPVVPISARQDQGIEELKNTLEQTHVVPDFKESLSDNVLEIVKQFGPKGDVLVRKQNSIDRWLLSSVGGGVFFAVIMLFLFQSIFSWASPLMDATEMLIEFFANLIVPLLPEGVFADFVQDALFGGIGSFLVFVPQIFILTLIIGLLEDSGYLSRAAIICHRPLSFFGLSGKSFVPMLSGHACAIPAIMAARTIESPRRRWLTMLTVPLMSCSARLPVYSLFIVAFIPSTTFFGGLLGYQGLTFFALYFLGIFIALIVSALLSKSVAKSESDSPFVIELPPYRLPHWKPLLLKSYNSAKDFVVKAGGIIFTVTVMIWVLGYFPSSGDLGSSYLASLGRIVEPLFAPLGVDWKYAVAILVSFLAREVFVGTLGTMFGIEGADENIAGLAENMSASGLTFASGMALLVFYVIAMQCVSTLAVLKKELSSYKAPILIFFGYSFLAWILAWVTYLILV